jgi:Spy/CpxP family protein refolding chaperone
MLRTKTWFVLVLLIVFLPATVMAQGMMRGKWWNDNSMAEELHLTDSERNRLNEKYVEGRRKMIDLMSAVEKERLELDIALDNPDADKARINEHYAKLEKARAELSKARFDLIIEMRDIIGVGRFQTLQDMHRSRRNNMGDMPFKDRPSRRGRY